MNNIERLPTGAVARFDWAANLTGKCMVIVPGWESSPFTGATYDRIRKVLTELLGISTLTVSLRGHEGAEGDLATLTREDHLADIMAAFAHLYEYGQVDPDWIGGLGVSYGGYLLSAASKDLKDVSAKLRVLALRAPALYPDEGWDEPMSGFTGNEEVRNWRTTVRGESESKALGNLSSFTGDLLIVPSQHDESIPQQVIKSYGLAARSARTVMVKEVPGAGHTLDDTGRERFVTILGNWLASTF